MTLDELLQIFKNQIYLLILSHNLFSDFSMQINQHFIHELVKIYAGLVHYQRDFKTALKFSWEDDSLNTIKEAIESTHNTDILVVIGYSFPFFNRAVDREIIREMKLKKVYIQNESNDINRVRTGFLSIKPDMNPKDIVDITDTSQFFLPPEL